MVAITTNPVRRPAPSIRPSRSRALHAVPERTVVAQSGRALRHLGLLALLAVVVLAVGYLASTTATPPGAVASVATLEAHVVAEGETMWSIAQDIAPAGEAATYVERLVEANGGSAVAAGQVLTVPVP